MEKNNQILYLVPQIYFWGLSSPRTAYTPRKGRKAGLDTLSSEAGLMHPGSC